MTNAATARDRQRRRRDRERRGSIVVRLELDFDALEDMRLRGRLGTWDEEAPDKADRIARAVLTILDEWRARHA